MDRLGRVQRRALYVIKWWRTCPIEERLKELGLFTLERRRLGGDLITVLQCLQNGYKRG